MLIALFESIATNAALNRLASVKQIAYYFLFCIFQFAIVTMKLLLLSNSNG